MRSLNYWRETGRAFIIFCFMAVMAYSLIGNGPRSAMAAELFPEQRVITSSASCVCTLFPIDVNGDQKIDILSASFGDAQIAWYENDGQNPPNFTQHIITRDLAGSLWICGADLDGDGDIDVVNSERDNNRICWYENSGGKSPGFKRHIVTTDAVCPVGIRAVDLDGDGHIDIVSSSDTENTIAWYRNDGQHPPTFTRIIISRAYRFPEGIDVRDINGDGHPDIVAAFQYDNSFVWFENDGKANPTFTAHTIASGFQSAIYVHLADINGDGKMDVVGCSGGDNKIAWFENNGGAHPTFTTHLINSNAPSWPGNLYAADLNHDGHMDVLSSSISGNKFYWYENNGEAIPSFTPHLLGTGNGAAGNISADFNNDGLPDIATSAMYDYKIAWYPNKLQLPAVQVSFPQGGEIFQGNSLITITWKTDVNRAGTAVQFELWNQTGWVMDLGSAWNADGHGTCEVYLPLLPVGGDYWIRAISLWDSSLTGRSVGSFTINGGLVHVIWPADNEIWPAGSIQAVTWKTNPTISGTAVSLELWRNERKYAELAIDWNAAGQGTVFFQTPSGIPPGAYRVRAVSLWNPLWWDDSDNWITIQNDHYRSAIQRHDWDLYR